MTNSGDATERVWSALDNFRIEMPSWGFANTGTRFGKFVQGGAATTIEEKFADAAEVNTLTGASPTIALHVLWDMSGGLADISTIQTLEKKYAIKAGSINPNLFQDAQYKFGSIANPDAEVRAAPRKQDEVPTNTTIRMQGPAVRLTGDRQPRDSSDKR